MVIAAVALRAVVRIARSNLRRYEIAERSMEPTLRAGDWVIAIPWRRAKRGDVVVIPHPERPGFELVKRVIGLPGETVTVTAAGDVVILEGGADEWGRAATLPAGVWKVPADTVFVLGDARHQSNADSRVLGSLPRESIEWQIRFRYWPPDRIGFL